MSGNNKLKFPTDRDSSQPGKLRLNQASGLKKINTNMKEGNSSFNTVTGGSGGTSALGQGSLSLKIN